MKFHVKCLENFKDGTLFDRMIVAGEEMVVSPRMLERLKQSSPSGWEKLGMVMNHVCPDCGFEAKNEAGLKIHMRSCDD